MQMKHSPILTKIASIGKEVMLRSRLVKEVQDY